MIGQMAGMFVGSTARQAFSVVPPLRVLDSAGGVMLGALTGLALVWAVGAVLLYVPGQNELRRLAQESAVVSALTEAVPPERVMDAVGRIDPFTAFAGPDVDVGEPNPAIAGVPPVRGARNSVVRVQGVACGLGVEGSGWIVRTGLVVTNAHIVAGVASPVVDRGSGNGAAGKVVSFDAGNDVAIVSVAGLEGRPLPLGSPTFGAAGALLGFPLERTVRRDPVRVGGSADIAARDAYGRIPGPARGDRPARRRPERELGRPGPRRAGRCRRDALREALRVRQRGATRCRTRRSRRRSRTSVHRFAPPASSASRQRQPSRSSAAERCLNGGMT